MEQKDVWTVAVRFGDEIATCEMVMIEGQPHVVWEWHEDAANEYPGVTIPLEREHLQPAHGANGCDFVYGLQLQVPDPAS